MSRARWWPAAAVALASLGLVLLTSWWNRSGGRRETVLSELETELVGDGGRGIALLVGEPPAEAGSRVTVERLAALGVDTSTSALPMGLGAHPVRGYVVLELGGLVWRRHVERIIRDYVARVVSPDTVPERQDSLLIDFRRTQEERRSRLVLADAGTDGEALAAAYADPSHYLILPADLGVRRGISPGERLIPAIHIHGLHLPLPGSAFRILTAEGVPVRYRVTIATGRRFEPWVAGAELLEGRRLDSLPPDSVRRH